MQGGGDLQPRGIFNVRYGIGNVENEGSVVAGTRRDTDGAFVGLALDAGGKHFGGGFKLEVYGSDDDLYGAAFTSSKAAGVEIFPHFTIRPTGGDIFRIPIRIGPYVQVHALELETATTDRTISFVGIGGQVEIEPEIDFVRTDNIGFGLYGRLRLGLASAKIDNDIGPDDFDTNSSNLGTEIGLRFQAKLFLVGAGFMTRSTNYDRSDPANGTTFPESDFRFEGFFIDMGLRW